jgi:hypothetical protein
MRTFAAILLSFFAVSTMCFGQTPLTPTTVVTGQCQGHESEPGCVLPNLFGPTGLTLFNNPALPHFAHFVGSAQTTLNQTLSSAIATQLAILPIISPASGFTYKYDSAAGAFVRSTTSFGPIYTERAETIGRGKFSFGVSYQRFRFSNLDGVDLHNVPAVLTHVPNTGPGGTPAFYEVDVISSRYNISLNMDQTMVYGTVGLTNRLDFSVAVPFVSVRMGVVSDANIVDVAGQPMADPHEFDAQGSQSKTFGSNGSAAGVGDVTFRIKAAVVQAQPVRVAFALDVRAPSGSAREFLGSGATGIKPFIAISTGKRFSPHVNLGYQWNGESILAGNITGTTFPAAANGTALIQNGPAVKASLPSQFFYSLGADVGATSRLTLSFDYLGQTLFNAPRVFRTKFVTANVPGGTGALSLPTISGGKDDVGLNSGAAGLKYNLFGNLLLTANILFRLDNKGLRQDVTPLVALSYAFGH